MSEYEYRIVINVKKSIHVVFVLANCTHLNWIKGYSLTLWGETCDFLLINFRIAILYLFKLHEMLKCNLNKAVLVFTLLRWNDLSLVFKSIKAKSIIDGFRSWLFILYYLIDYEKKHLNIFWMIIIEYLNSPMYKTDNGNKSESLKYGKGAAFNFTRILITPV